MKVLVIGAGAGTGRQIVEQAVARGYDVTAFVRNPHQYDKATVHVVVGDARDERAISEAVAGQDAVFNTIGTQTPWVKTRLEPIAGRAINKALSDHGVRRLIVATTMGVGDSGKHAHFFFSVHLRANVPPWCGERQGRDGARTGAHRYRLGRGPPSRFDQ